MPNVKAKTSILMDYNSGKILHENEIDEKSMDKFGQELIEALYLYGVVELVSHGIPNVLSLIHI